MQRSQMFLAHMPAGYLTSKFLLSKFRFQGINNGWFMFAGLLGSVFPDFDMLYFYTIDNRQHGHHSYWTHIPFFWFCILFISYSIAFIFRSRFLVTIATVFIGCILLHLTLDSFAGGGIKWLYPIDNTYYNIFSIPGGNRFWVLNYIWHWTAFVELTIILLALFTFCKSRNIKRRTT